MEVRDLLASMRVELGLELVAGRAGLDRRIGGSTIQKPGLALTGFTSLVKAGRVQLLGTTEIDYLRSLTGADQDRAATALFESGVPMVVITDGAAAPEQLVTCADRLGVPLLKTGLTSALLVDALHKYLADELDRTGSIHGVLVDVFGVGVLIIGKSGVGKSECALELVMRGHRLVADDVVDVIKRPPSAIVGRGDELIRHHMEIRGLGIINIKDLFGVAAIRETKRIQLVIDMVEWQAAAQYDRLGVEPKTYEILEVPIPLLVIPIGPGRPLTSIVEVAARDQLLKAMGHHSAIEFQHQIDARLVGAESNRNEREDDDGSGDPGSDAGSS